MRQVYRLVVSVPPEDRQHALELLAAELGVDPERVADNLDFDDESVPKRLATRLHEAIPRFAGDVRLITQYDESELDNAELLQFSIVDECDSLRRAPAEAWFRDEPTARDYSDPPSDPLYLDYSTAHNQRLAQAAYSHEIVVARDLKELWERHEITGVTYWPIVDASFDHRPVSSTIEYYLAHTHCSLPPLDPRTLVTPSKLRDAQRWNFAVMSAHYYTREALTTWCDVNRVGTDHLSERSIPTLIVSQRLRQLLRQAVVDTVRYRPVHRIPASEPVAPVPIIGRWTPHREMSPVMSLGEARERYRSQRDA